jgi:nicotinate-nucleotide pyrophosphorylase (carboxylating)
MNVQIPEATLKAAVLANVEAALVEDVGTGDVSASLIDPHKKVHARIITRDSGVWCGSAWVTETLRRVAPEAELAWSVRDADAVSADQTCFEIRGLASQLLTAERTMLNFAQLISGTATLTRKYVSLIAHTRTRVLDTRKTIPGLRVAQKYAVACGGGANHRLGLYDAFLLKENHIAAAGSITGAVQRARATAPGLRLEVEVETLAQLEEAIRARADIVMLDNFDVARTRDAVDLAQGRVVLESSGGINVESITEYAEAGVDYISVGNLTKQIEPLDLSMRFV